MFPSNLNVSISCNSGNIEILGKQGIILAVTKKNQLEQNAECVRVNIIIMQHFAMLCSCALAGNSACHPLTSKMLPGFGNVASSRTFGGKQFLCYLSCDHESSNESVHCIKNNHSYITIFYCVPTHLTYALEHI